MPMSKWSHTALSLLAVSSVTGAARAQAQPAPDAPPPPSTWAQTPVSTSGSQLAPSGGAPAQAGDGDVNARVHALEAQVAAMQAEDAKRHEKLDWFEHLRLTGFVQPQLVLQTFNAAASPNAGATGLPKGIGSNDVIAKADGTTTNPDYFRMRRARLKTEYMPTDFAKFVLEIDPTPTGGPSAGIGTVARNVEAIGIAKWTSDIETQFGAGIFKIPFGYEVLQSDADRPFIERSWGEQNLTPAEYDTGARAYTTALKKKLAIQVAVVNGATQGEKNFAIVPDLNKGKDVVGRIAYDFGVFDVGVSGDYGQGQVIDATTLRFKQFPRWGANLEAALHHTFLKSLGATRVFAEATLAKNLDRGTKYAVAVPAIPVDIVNGFVQDHDERNTWLRVEQDLGEYLTLAARYEYYTPDSAQANDGRDTYAVVGVVHFTKGLQLMIEGNHAIDNVHKPGAQAPSKQIETLSTTLQARF